MAFRVSQFIYIKSYNFVNEKYFRTKARNHIVKSWSAMIKGNKMPALSPKDERFNREVAFVEATTESISQFTLGNVIVRIFGISDDPTSKALQYFSLATSSLSLSLAFVIVSTYLRDLIITQTELISLYISYSVRLSLDQ